MTANRVGDRACAPRLLPDREEAGRRLARVLLHARSDDGLVLGLSPGGIAVADAVSRGLGLPFDILVVRALTAPRDPALTIGAVTADGSRIVDRAAVRALDVSDDALTQITANAVAEAKRTERRLRVDLPPLDLRGREVILVDEGLAASAPARAAARSIRHAHAARVTVAVPVGAPHACAQLAREVDALVCLYQPADFRSAEAYFERFGPLDDAQVERILRDARQRR